MNTETTATQTAADDRRCFCPGDCNCQAPAWMFRTVFCGCRQHDTERYQPSPQADGTILIKDMSQGGRTVIRTSPESLEPTLAHVRKVLPA